MARLKPVVYQDQVQVQIPSGTTRVSSNPVDPKFTMPDSHGRIQVQQQVLDQGYILQQQLDQQQQQPQQQQQQFIHSTQQQGHEPGFVLQSQLDQQQQQQQFIHGAHFIHHTPSGAVQIPAYYPVYPSQQQLHPQHHHHQLEQQYQIYYVPARQTQPYNLSAQQPNINEPTTTIPSSHPQTTPNPATVQQSAAYSQMRNAPVPKSEMTAGAYRTAIAGATQLVQVPYGQPQQQFVTYSQYHPPTQSVAPNSAAPPSYAYEYTDPAHAQIYYSQPLAPTMPSQYQTMTGAGSVQPEVSAQSPSESMKQQIRTSQPL